MTHFTLNRALTALMLCCSILPVASADDVLPSRPITLTVPAIAQAADCEPVSENEALAAEDERYAAQLQSDVNALDRLLADDLVYIHSNAQVDSKQAFIDSLRSGVVKYLSMKRSDVRVRPFGCVAVITGLADYDVHFNGKDISVELRFHSVWARRDGRVQFISWQSTRTPAKSP